MFEEGSLSNIGKHLGLVTNRDNVFFVFEGNDSLRPCIQGPEGVMEQRKRTKKQPSRDDYAAAWRMIRDQSQIIKLQAETIRRQEKTIGTVLMTYPRLEELRVN